MATMVSQLTLLVVTCVHTLTITVVMNATGVCRFFFHTLMRMCMCAAAGVKGRTISLKLKRRKTNAPEPPKFMGHGDCDNMSRSVTLSRFTDSPAELASQGKALLKALKVDPTQIRGIGLNVSHCVSTCCPLNATDCQAYRLK